SRTDGRPAPRDSPGMRRWPITPTVLSRRVTAPRPSRSIGHGDVAGHDGREVDLVGLAGAAVVREGNADRSPDDQGKYRMSNDPIDVRGVAVEDDGLHVDEPRVGRPSWVPRNNVADPGHRAVGDAVVIQPGVNADLAG